MGGSWGYGAITMIAGDGSSIVGKSPRSMYAAAKKIRDEARSIDGVGPEIIRRIRREAKLKVISSLHL